MTRTRQLCHAVLAGIILLPSLVALAQGLDSAIKANKPSTRFVGLASEIARLTPDSDEQLFYYHYVTSNEPYHAVYLDGLQPRGGVFIGVGTDQNFVSIPTLKPEVLIFLDFDQWVIDVHKVYRYVFATRDTPEQFVDFFSYDNRRSAIAELRRSLSNEPKLESVLHAFSESRKKIFARLTAEKYRHLFLKKNTYLTAQSAYNALSQLARGNRYFAVRANLTKVGAMQQLGISLKRQNLAVGALALTNAEQYFKYGKAYRSNLLGLPWQSDALIIRTYRKMPEKRYEYFLQNWLDFKSWLERPNVSDVKDLLKKRRPGNHSLSFWLPGPDDA